MRFRNQSRTHSAPSRGIVPQGKGREGKGRDKELTHPCLSSHYALTEPVDNWPTSPGAWMAKRIGGAQCR